MKEYGILLSNRDDRKQAGLIMVDSKGVLIVSGGEEEWNYGVHKNLLGQLQLSILPEPLYKKYQEVYQVFGYLSEQVIVNEVWRITEAINESNITVLGHLVKSYPLIFEDRRPRLLRARNVVSYVDLEYGRFIEYIASDGNAYYYEKCDISK